MKRVDGNSLTSRDTAWGLDILLTETETNPVGWQMVAGGRSGQRGNDHRKACSRLAHPGGVPDQDLTCNRSGTPAGVRDLSYAWTTNPRESPGSRRLPQ
jgi:hypothetical protein